MLRTLTLLIAALFMTAPASAEPTESCSYDSEWVSSCTSTWGHTDPYDCSEHSAEQTELRVGPVTVAQTSWSREYGSCEKGHCPFASKEADATLEESGYFVQVDGGAASTECGPAFVDTPAGARCAAYARATIDGEDLERITRVAGTPALPCEHIL